MHGVEHRVVLHRGREHPAAALVSRPPRPEQALHREVVRLGAAAGEDHLARPGTEHLGDLLPRLLDHPAGTAPRIVQRRGVAEPAEFLRHRVDRLGQQRRGRGMIEIYDRASIHGGFSLVPAASAAARAYSCLRLPTSSRSCGTTVNRSPTMPRSAISKMGASGSLLIAMIVLEVCMPARCWMAPEMPTAMYSWGETVLPVCPTWNACGYQPASVTARDAPTAAPRLSASFSMMPNPSADPVPRPPETTICASVSSGRSPLAATTRSDTWAALAASDAVNATASTAATSAPADGSGVIAFGRTAMIGVPARTVEWTVIEPPKLGCSATGAPSGPAVTLTASVSTPEFVLTASRPAISL